MVTTTRPLLERTAEELMTANVVTIPLRTSLSAAANLLVEGEVGGAPVVDEGGRCVGMLTATDLLRWMHDGEQTLERPANVPCFHCGWEGPDDPGSEPGTVERYMTADPLTAGPDTPLGALVRRMAEARARRVIVTDQGGRPVGVLSALDVVAALAGGEEGRP